MKDEEIRFEKSLSYKGWNMINKSYAPKYVLKTFLTMEKWLAE